MDGKIGVWSTQNVSFPKINEQMGRLICRHEWSKWKNIRLNECIQD